MKILEIAIDKGVKQTRYWTLNYSIGCDSKFFEGESSKSLKPLQEAKIWAKKNGYDALKVISLKSNVKDKIYIL